MGRVVSSDDTIRIMTFAVVFMAMAMWELAAGRRELMMGRGQRWPTNLAMLVFGVGVVRVMMPLTVVEIADLGHARGWGLCGLLALPLGVATVVSIVALDLALYLHHLVFHYIPVLWRVHRVHHADPEVDVTTGLRFHPVEFIASTVFKVAAVLALGAPAGAVVIFEILLNVSSMFTHGNVSLPPPVDAMARRLFVTPDMHRIHHSVDRAEHNSNFGFNLAIWDRLCRTYRQDPEGGHDGMTIGLRVDPRRATALGSALRMPFMRGSDRSLADDRPVSTTGSRNR